MRHTVRLPILLLLTGSVCHLAPAQSPHLDKATPPTNLTPLPPSIGGRVVTQPDPANASFGARLYTYQWPGTYFQVAFRGTEVYFRTAGGHQNLHITIDHGQPLTVTATDAATYRISGLANKPHIVRIAVVSESQDAPDSFSGFALPHTASPLRSPAHPRQIEFIGDSHTVGYGNTSAHRECTADQIWALTDSSQGLGPLTAAHYNADFQINAISGRGIVRNYGGSAGDPLPVAYPFILFDKKVLYRDASWQPQIIVLSLGTNDFSTPLHPGEKWKTRDDLHADYEATYVRFLSDLRAQHPSAFIILWAVGAVDGEIPTEVSKVVQQRKAAGDTRIAFVPVGPLHMDACDWHPSTADDLTISQKLIDLIDHTPAIWQGK